MTAQAEHRKLKQLLKGKFSIPLREAREVLLYGSIAITDRQLKQEIRRCDDRKL